MDHAGVVIDPRRNLPFDKYGTGRNRPLCHEKHVRARKKKPRLRKKRTIGHKMRRNPTGRLLNAAHPRYHNESQYKQRVDFAEHHPVATPKIVIGKVIYGIAHRPRASGSTMATLFTLHASAPRGIPTRRNQFAHLRGKRERERERERENATHGPPIVSLT